MQKHLYDNWGYSIVIARDIVLAVLDVLSDPEDMIMAILSYCFTDILKSINNMFWEGPRPYSGYISANKNFPCTANIFM
jgi:hypothetical protein